ncbi:DUF4352 domain-containing protein [Lactobacillus sp. YT155]|uniref:DUF4352 domain-containing protein n=1 Tax=Lactobacillus sp. YT155 TaxID=3060955 RepID=UPI00265EC01D|nr:DUF4352 domain-containing protein [Lactobacillus sp. YT155]MDO1605653.1 DUF4352 domain-containing protein [Lactobacillus sp. YT155]
MAALVVLAGLFMTLSILALIGFGITLIVGVSTKSKGAKKTGIIGTSIAGGIFVLSIIGVISGAVASVDNFDSNRFDESSESWDSSDDSDYDDEDSDYDDDFDSYDVGQFVEFDEGDKISVTSIKDSSEKLPNMKTNEHAVEAEVKVKNPTSKTISFDVRDYDIYDGDGNLGFMNSKTHDQKDLPTEVKAGETITVKLYFTVNVKGLYSVTCGDVSWDQ